MKLIKLFLAALVLNSFIITISYSQSSWVRQDSTSYFNNSIDFANETTGFYVGNHKRIHKTTNGGQTWFELSGSDSTNYRKVICINDNIIFASNLYINIYKSTDSGNSWVTILIDSSSVLNVLQMYNANTGYIAGYAGVITPYNEYILKTTNGGLNWNVSMPAIHIGDLFTISCVNKDTSYACGYTTWKSLNGGISWSQFTFSIYEHPEFTASFFVNNTTGFMAGKITNSWGITFTYPAISRTTNGGDNWIGKNMASTEPGDKFNSIDFYDLNNGIVVSDSGCVYRTTNMGNNWIKQKKFSARILGVCFRGINKASISLSNGTIYSTTNGGWEIPSTPNLISPINNSSYIATTANMRWEKVQYNAAQYSLQVSLDSNFNTTVLDLNSLDTAGYDISTNILSADNTYFWHVKSQNPMYASLWSQTWKFNTNKPLAPNLLLPLNNDSLVSSSQILNWSAVLSVTNYNLQISIDSFFVQNSIDTILSINPNMLMPVSKLFSNKYYYWRVRGININGAGPYSGIWRFKLK